MEDERRKNAGCSVQAAIPNIGRIRSLWPVSVMYSDAGALPFQSIRIILKLKKRIKGIACPAAFRNSQLLCERMMGGC